IVPSLLPAGVNVHDEVSVSSRKCRCVGGHAPHGPSEVSHENLALRSRQASSKVCHFGEKIVAELAEIMRLPVVTGTRREQWVKRLLPARKRIETDHVGDWISQFSKWCQNFLAVAGIARKTYCQDQHLLAVPLLGEEWQRWSLAQHHPSREFI